jgi:hypothetical protein
MVSGRLSTWKFAGMVLLQEQSSFFIPAMPVVMGGFQEQGCSDGYQEERASLDDSERNTRRNTNRTDLQAQRSWPAPNKFCDGNHLPTQVLLAQLFVYDTDGRELSRLQSSPPFVDFTVILNSTLNYLK